MRKGEEARCKKPALPECSTARPRGGKSNSANVLKDTSTQTHSCKKRARASAVVAAEKSAQPSLPKPEHELPKPTSTGSVFDGFSRGSKHIEYPTELDKLFYCRSRRKALLAVKCMDDFVNANVFGKERSVCFRCAQGRRIRSNIAIQS